MFSPVCKQRISSSSSILNRFFFLSFFLSLFLYLFIFRNNSRISVRDVRLLKYSQGNAYNFTFIYSSLFTSFVLFFFFLVLFCFVFSCLCYFFVFFSFNLIYLIYFFFQQSRFLFVREEEQLPVSHYNPVVVSYYFS